MKNANEKEYQFLGNRISDKKILLFLKQSYVVSFIQGNIIQK